MIFFIITIGSLNIQDMMRILKQSGHDFSGTYLCDGFCMDIMCCLSGVKVIIPQRAIWFCEKASLRIVTLFCLNVKILEC